MPTIYHGTPITPNAAFSAVMPGRSACISYYRPDQLERAVATCPSIMLDNGAFSYWMKAVRSGIDPADAPNRDWRSFYDWLDAILFEPGRWAVIPDRPGAPSQMSDGLLNEWPHGRSKGAPVWHTDGSLSRLGRLCERYDRVCIGWIGHPKREPVGCIAYHDRMDEVATFLGNRWPPIHMMRGVAVAWDYPFLSADSTSLAQNGHCHDWIDSQSCMITGAHDAWRGRHEYANRLERIGYDAEPIREPLPRYHRYHAWARGAPGAGFTDESHSDGLGLW